MMMVVHNLTCKNLKKYANKKLGDDLKNIIFILILLLLVGCKSNPNAAGPAIQYLLHQKISFTKSNKELPEIAKGSKIYIEDVIDYNNYTSLYSRCIHPQIIDILNYPDDVYKGKSIALYAKKVFLSDGYKIVDSPNSAEYVILLEPGIFNYYKKLKTDCTTNELTHYTKKAFSLYNEKQKNIAISNESSIDNSLSFVNLGSSLTNAGHTNAGYASAAIGVLSLFGTKNPLIKITRVTIINTKTKKIDSALFTTKNAGSYKNTFGAIKNYQEHEIDKLLMLID